MLLNLLFTSTLRGLANLGLRDLLEACSADALEAVDEVGRGTGTLLIMFVEKEGGMGATPGDEIFIKILKDSSCVKTPLIAGPLDCAHSQKSYMWQKIQKELFFHSQLSPQDFPLHILA